MSLICKRFHWLGLLMLFISITIITVHVSAAELTTINNFTTDKNGSVLMEKLGSDENGFSTFEFTITPHTGYRIDKISTYVSGAGCIPGEYIDENLATLKDDTGSSKILYMSNNSPWYTKKDVKVSFAKITKTAKLKLTLLKDAYAFGDEIKVKVSIEDENGKTLVISKNGKLYLSFGDQRQSLGVFYKNSTYSSIMIDSKNIININSTYFNNTGEFELNGYYIDTKSGLIAEGEKVNVKISKQSATITLNNLIQMEGDVTPVTATSIPQVNDVQIRYKVLQSGEEIWTSIVPDNVGIYDVKAYITGNPQFENCEVFGRLAIKSSLDEISRATTITTSYDPDNFIKATINLNKTIWIEGAFNDCDIDNYSISMGNERINKTFLSNNHINESIDIGGLSDGKYELNVSYNVTKTYQGSNDMDEESDSESIVTTEYYAKYSAKFIVEIKGNEVYFLESKIYQDNQNEYQIIVSQDPTLFLDKEITSSSQYSDIKKKAEEITKGVSSDYEKIKLICMWISDNTYYDWDYYLHNISGSHVPYEPLNVFEHKIAICSGYARLAYVMLQSIGIPTKNITGVASVNFLYNDGNANPTDHEWNMAYAEDKGRWVIFDSTWNSKNRYENSQKNYNGVDYNYYDPTLEYFSYDHLFDNDTKNENAEPQFIDSCVIKIGEVKSLIKNKVYIESTGTTIYNSDIINENGHYINTGNINIIGNKEGKATIDVTVTLTNGVQYTHTIKVNVIDPNSDLNFIKKKSNMKVGDQYTFTTNLSKTLDIEWSSSNNKTATVNKKTGEVKAIKKGTFTLTAKIGDKTVKCKVIIS